MDPSGEDKLISLLTEIHSDIRQIKSDLQSLLTLLKQQQQRPTPASFSDSDDTRDIIESAQSGSRKTCFAISAKREGRVILKNEQARV